MSLICDLYFLVFFEYVFMLFRFEERLLGEMCSTSLSDYDINVG